MGFRLWLEDAEGAWKDFKKSDKDFSMVRRTWPDIFSSMDDEQVPNSKKNLERLEKTRRIRVALNQD